MEFLKLQDMDLKDKKVILAGCVEEESATSRGARNLIKKFKPNYIIVGEPSGVGNITIGYKGRLLVDYKSSKQITHTAGKNLGVIEDAFDYYYKISQIKKLVFCKEY